MITDVGCTKLINKQLNNIDPIFKFRPVELSNVMNYQKFQPLLCSHLLVIEFFR